MTRALIVDDSRISRIRLRKLLEAQCSGCEVTEVESAGAAVEALSDGWDVVFCDLLLPDSNGFSVVVDLKKHSGSTPVVVCSANAMPDVKEMASALGCVAYLEKPVRPDDLQGVLGAL